MFIELHIIQNFAPSNLNRDDTGNPKEAEFGGVRRARISSQAIKRAIRSEPIFADTVKKEFPEVEFGQRTQKLIELLAEELKARKIGDQDALEIATGFASGLAGGLHQEKSELTSVLLYMTSTEVKVIADFIVNHWAEALESRDKYMKLSDKKRRKIKKKQHPFKGLLNKLAKQFPKYTSAPDIALYGRMLAEHPNFSMDSATQVAHALSTHRVSMEIDFFTALDDLQKDEEMGASMMGVTGYNSATYYRYARIHWEQLLENLDGNENLARRTVEGFLRAALRAIPSGKQNSFAAQNPPSFALAVVRDDGMSWSLVNAFERPVRPDREGGYVHPSVRALDAYWGRLTMFYGIQGISPYVLNVDGVPLVNLADAEHPNLETWMDSIITAISPRSMK